MNRTLAAITTMAAWLIVCTLAVVASLSPAYAQVTEAAPQCSPSQMIGGTGTRAITRTVDSPVVMCARWWCPPAGGTGPWVSSKAAVMPTYYIQSSRDPIEADINAGNATGLAARRNLPMSNTNFVRCTDDAAFLARHAAARPPTSYLHYVAPNSASTSTPPTRPVYELIGGVRGTREVGRAVVGDGCNPAIARSGDYMAFAPSFAADRVTLCR